MTLPPDYPNPVIEPKKRGLSLIWLVPLIAILAGIGLVVRTAMERGPEISVSFKNADGIEPGKTKVRYKSVEIGVVERVELSDDLEKIHARIRMSKSVTPLLVEDARFWVERPRVSGTNVEGLSTLLSGAFIGMDIGKSKRAERSFNGLDRPPLVTFTEPGTHYRLRARQLGSLDSGSQIFYRRVAVGQVVRYEMDEKGRGLDIEIFIKAPYDRFVNAETRFWEASGVDVELSASGLRVETQSLNAILSGGIAFDTRGDPEKAAPAEKSAVFRLFDRKTTAMAQEDDEVVSMRLAFNESVRGLAVGAPVDFRGIEIGKVTGIGGEVDQAKGLIQMVVDVDLYPNRLRQINVKQARKMPFKEGLNALVGGGLRAQLRTGNVIAGQLFVALDYFKDSPKASVDWSNNPPVMPTIPGSLARIEQQLQNMMLAANALLQKLNALPLEQLSVDASAAMRSLDSTLKNIDRQLDDGSLMQQDLRDSLRELSKAAAEARTFLEYQSKYPESLIKGKSKEE
ncbi:MAG: MlaD family protein [Rhodocyclaceae bacterium]|nr:MlaD family protein [Rhodocyclaceae bacterium]